MKVLSTAILTMFAVLVLGTGLYAAPVVGCGGQFGTQFNLEPAANAVPQQLENVDFIPNRVGLNLDLVVAGALDGRGAPPSSGGGGISRVRGLASASPTWDGSESGYYVHRSATADCSPQFEGGLPNVISSGKTFVGVGDTVIAADPRRDAFFAADVRMDNADSLSAIGLFRASSATLLSSTLCPNGTHTAAQATACWGTTAPVLVGQAPSFGAIPSQDLPSLAVDERATGVGAGNVYVAFGTGSTMALAACKGSTLACSAPLTISDSTDASTIDAHVEVRPDGIITVTYNDANFAGVPDTIKFVSCTPAGAPTPPVCG